MQEKVRIAGLVTAVRPYTTKTNKPMDFVTMEDIQGNIELVLFPRTWAQYREQMTVGQIIIVEGKADMNANVPKILVDTVRMEIKILEPLEAAAPSTPEMDSVFDADFEPAIEYVTPRAYDLIRQRARLDAMEKKGILGGR